MKIAPTQNGDNKMINRIVLVGRMVADPELRYTPSGVATVKFCIAVNRSFANAQGEREADFIDIVAWRQSAQFVADYMRKGRLVGVDGRLQIRSYVTQDGQKRKVTEVVAEHVRALDRGRDEDKAPSSQAADEGAGYEAATGSENDAFEGQ
jgi:single-strand DNA-binding protein